MAQYRDYYTDKRGASPRTVELELARVARFWGRDNGPLVQLTLATAQALYSDLRRRPCRTGRPCSIAEQHGAVKAARRFGRWLVRRDIWRSTPLGELELEGRALRGEASKAQLSQDQARTWLDGALAAHDLGDQAALAAAVCLVMGRRAGEVAERRCSHLDNSGTVLRITRAKTERGRKPLPIPEVLQAPLQEQVRRARAWGRQQPVAQLDPPLFPPVSYEPGIAGNNRGGQMGDHLSNASVRRAVHRICRALGLPLVTTHALRGTFASVGVGEGVAIEAVAAALGHASAVTRRHYASDDAQAAGEQLTRARALEGER